MKLSRVALLAGFGWLALVRPVRADPRIAVSETGPTCETSTLQGRVDQYLAPSVPDSVPDLPWQAHATLRHEETGVWRIDLDIQAPQAPPTTRMVRAEDCAGAIDAAAYLLALAIDPEVGQRPTPPMPEGAPKEPKPKPPPPRVDPSPPKEKDPPAAPPPEDRPRRDIDDADRLRGVVRAVAGFTGGAMPGVNAAFGGTIGLIAEGWRVELYGFYRLASTVRADLVPDAGARISQYVGGPRACYVPGLRKHKIAFEFPLCGGAEGGLVIGEGFGFEGASGGTRAWGAVTLSPGAAIVVLPQLAFVVSAEVAFALARKPFFIEGLETVFRNGPVSGRGFAGFEVRFP